jgi:hypothetical protein
MCLVPMGRSPGATLAPLGGIRASPRGLEFPNGTFRLKPNVIERSAAERVACPDPWESGTPSPNPH